MDLPSTEIQQHFFIFAGSTVGLLLVMFSIIRGYRWVIGEIGRLITAAFTAHEKEERVWQAAIQDKLDGLHKKVDVIDQQIREVERRMDEMEVERKYRHKLDEALARERSLPAHTPMPGMIVIRDDENRED